MTTETSMECTLLFHRVLTRLWAPATGYEPVIHTLILPGHLQRAELLPAGFRMAAAGQPVDFPAHDRPEVLRPLVQQSCARPAFHHFPVPRYISQQQPKTGPIGLQHSQRHALCCGRANVNVRRGEHKGNVAAKTGYHDVTPPSRNRLALWSQRTLADYDKPRMVEARRDVSSQHG